MSAGAVKARMIMDNLERAAQGTLSEREALAVVSRLCLDRWDDDGGQEAPTNTALTVSHHQASSSPTQRPQELAALACLADDSGNACDTRGRHIIARARRNALKSAKQVCGVYGEIDDQRRNHRNATRDWVD